MVLNKMANVTLDKLLAVGAGALGIMYTINKKPPEWLVASMLIAASVQLVNDVNALSMKGCDHTNLPKNLRT